MKPTNYNNQYETYELVLKDDEDEVFALSLVENPAIQSDFVYFNESGKMEVKFATADADKHTIVGPILIPDLKILRLKEDGKTPYYVTFTKDTVRKVAQKYIKDNIKDTITQVINNQKGGNLVDNITNAVTKVVNKTIEGGNYKSRSRGSKGGYCGSSMSSTQQGGKKKPSI